MARLSLTACLLTKRQKILLRWTNFFQRQPAIIWTGNEPVQRVLQVRSLRCRVLLLHHSRSSGGIVLQDFDNDFTNREFFMGGMRRRGHAVKDHSSSFNIVGKFAQGCMVLLSFSPKACFPARSAHSAAWMLVLPPLIMLFFPLTAKRTFRTLILLLKKFSLSSVTQCSRVSKISLSG